MHNSIIITTINKETEAIKKFKNFSGWDLVLVGDEKSHNIKDNKLTYLDVKTQNRLNFELVKNCPYNHYTRKNIGYLYALQQGSQIIYETDDDNIPYDYWDFPKLDGKFKTTGFEKYYNIYQKFTKDFVWPRGFPLNLIKNDYRNDKHYYDDSEIGAWQGLADLDPDVDAIYRLVIGNEITFERKEPLLLEKGTYCPFNSQNTLWRREMMPYAYLPSTVSFRFTDILRGYIAQRCFWQHGYKLGFCDASVYQLRNQHDLMKDFDSEIQCYQNIEKVVKILDVVNLDNDYENNLLKIYNELCKNNIVLVEEIDILSNWIKDIKKLL